MKVPPSLSGVDGAACHVEAVEEVLLVGNTLVVAHVEAAVVAEDAWPDLVLAAFLELRDPGLVGEEGAGEAGRIQASRLYLIGRDIGVEAACRDDRDVDEGLDVLDVGEVAVLGHVDWRMGPVPGVVGAVVAVEHVVACVLEVLGGLLALSHVASGLLEVLSGQGTLPEALGHRAHRVAQRDGEVVTALGLDRLDDFDGEAVAVLEGSSILVTPVVEVGQCELVEQVAFMDGMYFDAVDSRLLQEVGRLGEGCDYVEDLLARDLSGWKAVRPAVGSGGRRRSDLVQIHHRL